MSKQTQLGGQLRERPAKKGDEGSHQERDSRKFSAKE